MTSAFQKNNPMHSSPQAGECESFQPLQARKSAKIDAPAAASDENSCENLDINPMHSSSAHWLRGLAAFAHAPRCGAKRRAGGACRSPAMHNGRCRMHGGASPGAPPGNRNALKHGQTTGAGLVSRTLAREGIRVGRAVVKAAEAQAAAIRQHRLTIAALLRAEREVIHAGHSPQTKPKEPDA